jgi:hypothetical protein
VGEACGDERALASRIVTNEGIGAAERLALSLALDIIQLGDGGAGVELKPGQSASEHTSDRIWSAS